MNHGVHVGRSSPVVRFSEYQDVCLRTVGAAKYQICSYALRFFESTALEVHDLQPDGLVSEN